ncbi:ParB/RepB/Spo0J family partition protein [Candidatus Puniceispirillum sp.]|nr:ParB/RepB/Spo0J family partition protein [Candidatus Puniceispirillum sp.]
MSPKTPPAAPASKKTATRGLGRGLSSLLGDRDIATATGAMASSSGAANAPSDSGLREIPIEWINVGPWQPRRRFDKVGLDELAASIRQKGIVQPILLRPNPEKSSRYQLVAGERRWRAAQLAKIHQVPAIIRDLSDAECYEIALIENIQRSDLSVLEEAQGYQKLLETNRYTQEQLSNIIGKSRSHIANLLRLLLLPLFVQNLLLDRTLTMGQVRPLIGHDQAEALAKMIVAKGLSARQAEALAKQPAGKPGQKSTPIEKSADIKALEKQAAEKLGLALHIDWNKEKDRGKVTIDCQSLDQMTNLLARLGIG